jgi:hypothetical protein
MLSTLAQAEPAVTDSSAASPDLWAHAHHFFQTVVEIFTVSSGAPLAHPSELLGKLGQLGEIWALAFVVMGLVCLLNGYKFHKVVTVSLLVIMGAVLGYWMGLEIKGPPFVVAAMLSILLGALAFPLMKYAIAILGGLSGAFIGANLWLAIATFLNPPPAGQEPGTGTATTSNETLLQVGSYIPADSFWIGALIGLMVCGIGAFILSKVAIHLFTTVSGSTITVFGVIALLLSIDTFRETVTTELTRSPLIIPLLVFVPAAIGFLMQEKASGAWGGGDQAAAA